MITLVIKIKIALVRMPHLNFLSVAKMSEVEASDYKTLRSRGLNKCTGCKIL